MAEQETPQNLQQTSATPQPGSTITPAGAPRSVEDRLTAIETSAEQPVQQVVVPLRQPATVQPTAVAPPTPLQQPIAASPQVVAPQPQVQPIAPPQQPLPVLPIMPARHQSQPQAPAPEPDQFGVTDEGAIVWTASEFIAHAKSTNWYFMLFVAAIAGAGLVFLLTRDLISSAVIIVCALAFGFYAGRQPRQIRYALTDSGIGIGEKFYPLEDFRSFTVARDGAFSSVIFSPLKRFGMFTTIYYAPENEDAIVGLLAEQMPFEEHRPDVVDRLMRKVRF